MPATGHPEGKAIGKADLPADKEDKPALEDYKSEEPSKREMRLEGPSDMED